MIKRFWIFIFFLSIFLIFSIPDKSNFNLRFAVASTHYFFIFSSGLILLLFYSYKIGFNAKTLQIFLLFFFFIVWMLLFSNTNLTYHAKIFLNVFIGYISYLIIYNFRDSVVQVLKIILVLNLFLFFIQFFYHLIFGLFIDFHSLFFPFSRNYQNEILELDKYVRFSGIHYEPGYYSIISSLLILLIILLDKKKNNILLIIATILSIIITKSIVGIFISFIILFLSFNLINKKVDFSNKFYNLIYILAFFIFVYISDGFSYLTERFFDLESFRSFQQKNTVFIDFLNRDFIQFILGSGIEATSNILVDRNVGFVKDIGLFFNFIHTAGLFGVFVILFIFLNIKVKPKSKKYFIFILLAVCKLDFLFPLFFVIIFLIFNPFNISLKKL